jgi:hypothetical protein
MNMDDDFDSFWNELQGSSGKPLIVFEGKPRDYTYGLEDAAAKATFDMRTYMASLGPHPVVTSEMLTQLVTRGIHGYMRHWYDAYRNQDVAGLVEFIIDGLNLPAADLKGMMRAFPMSLIDRVVRGVTLAGTGIHALFALEWHYRSGNLPSDYEIYREADDKTRVKIMRNGEAVIITLDDVFRIPEEHGVEPGDARRKPL